MESGFRYQKYAVPEKIRRNLKTVEELSKLTGVPAYYIEGSLKNLIYREAVLKQSNRYITDFMFIDSNVCNRKAEELTEGIYRKLIDCLLTLEGDIWERAAFSLDAIFPFEKDRWTRYPFRYDGG